MKRFTHIDTDAQFQVVIFWNEERQILRIESGPTESPCEMVAEFQGLSKWGAIAAIRLMLDDMIGCSECLADALEELKLN